MNRLVLKHERGKVVERKLVVDSELYCFACLRKSDQYFCCDYSQNVFCGRCEKGFVKGAVKERLEACNTLLLRNKGREEHIHYKVDFVAQKGSEGKKVLGDVAESADDVFDFMSDFVRKDEGGKDEEDFAY